MTTLIHGLVVRVFAGEQEGSGSIPAHFKFFLLYFEHEEVILNKNLASKLCFGAKWRRRVDCHPQVQTLFKLLYLVVFEIFGDT